MRYQTLFELQYAFRIKTEAIFENLKEYIFDFYVLDDPKYDDFFLFKNIWRETLLLHSLTQKQDQKVNKVLSFGQLPNKIIYREIEECSSVSLEEFLRIRD